MANLRAALDMFWTDELEQLAAARPIRGDKAMAAEKSVLVPLGPDETFAMLTEPERLRRWQAVTARIDLRAGGDYRWTIIPGHTAAGTITEVEPGKRLVLTFGWEGDEDLPPGASTVTITLEPAEGGTSVRLVHAGLNAEQVTGHLEGWNHYLDRLVAACEHGDAGPDEWAAHPEPLDHLIAAEASLGACQAVLRGTRPEDGSAATPCAKYTVDELTDHLFGSIQHLGGTAGADIADGGDRSREARIADAAQQALEAWRRRGLEGTVTFGSAEAPATLAAGILSIELLVHAWDFANATGQTLAVDDALSDYVLDLARGTIAPGMRDGDRFAAEVEAGADADALDRLAAFTGRNTS
jgi:uncharacterized protein (TIGR03086 family)